MSNRPDGWPIFGRDAPDVAWRPDPAIAPETRLARFLAATGEPDLERLQARASVDPAWFWASAVDDLALDWQRSPRTTLDTSAGVEWSTWWGGGAFNHAAASVDRRARLDPLGSAIAWEAEDGEVRTLGNLELRDAVDLAASMLHAHGVRAGDRVGILLPMLIETAVAVLALGKLEAIFTPIFSGYGAEAIAARLADCEASMLITADRSWRRGGMVPLKSTADAAVAMVPSVREVLVVRRVRGSGTDRSDDEPPPSDVPWTTGRDHWWHDRPAQGRAPRPWRLPHQGRPGPRSRLRPSPRRPALLVHGPGLDDGSLGHQRGVAAGRVARPL